MRTQRTHPPVSIVTVTRGGYFFVRLLVEKVREFTTDRDFEIIAVDRGSRDGTVEYLSAQPEVRLVRDGLWERLARRPWRGGRAGHRHGPL